MRERIRANWRIVFLVLNLAALGLTAWVIDSVTTWGFPIDGPAAIGAVVLAAVLTLSSALLARHYCHTDGETDDAGENKDADETDADDDGDSEPTLEDAIDEGGPEIADPGQSLGGGQQTTTSSTSGTFAVEGFDSSDGGEEQGNRHTAARDDQRVADISTSTAPANVKTNASGTDDPTQTNRDSKHDAQSPLTNANTDSDVGADAVGRDHDNMDAETDATADQTSTNTTDTGSTTDAGRTTVTDTTVTDAETTDTPSATGGREDPDSGGTDSDSTDVKIDRSLLTSDDGSSDNDGDDDSDSDGDDDDSENSDLNEHTITYRHQRDPY